MPAELQSALVMISAGFAGVVAALLGGTTLIIRATMKRQAAKIETKARWEQEQLEMRLKEEAHRRQIAYEEKMAEIAEKADMRAALDRQSQQLENAVNAIVDIAKSDSRKTEVLAANTQQLSSNTQTLEIFGDNLNDVAVISQHTLENVNATRKAAETAIADHALILERLEGIRAEIRNISALFTPVPELPVASTKEAAA